MSLEDKWASLDKKLDGILRNQSYIIQKGLTNAEPVGAAFYSCPS